MLSTSLGNQFGSSCSAWYQTKMISLTSKHFHTFTLAFGVATQRQIQSIYHAINVMRLNYTHFPHMEHWSKCHHQHEKTNHETDIWCSLVDIHSGKLFHQLQSWHPNEDSRSQWHKFAVWSLEQQPTPFRNIKPISLGWHQWQTIPILESTRLDTKVAFYDQQ